MDHRQILTYLRTSDALATLAFGFGEDDILKWTWKFPEDLALGKPIPSWVSRRVGFLCRLAMSIVTDRRLKPHLIGVHGSCGLYVANGLSLLPSPRDIDIIWKDLSWVETTPTIREHPPFDKIMVAESQAPCRSLLRFLRRLFGEENMITKVDPTADPWDCATLSGHDYSFFRLTLVMPRDEGPLRITTIDNTCSRLLSTNIHKVAVISSGHGHSGYLPSCMIKLLGPTSVPAILKLSARGFDVQEGDRTLILLMMAMSYQDFKSARAMALVSPRLVLDKPADHDRWYCFRIRPVGPHPTTARTSKAFDFM